MKAVLRDFSKNWNNDVLMPVSNLHKRLIESGILMKKLQCINYSRKTRKTDQDRFSIKRNVSHVFLPYLDFSACDDFQVSVLAPLQLFRD